ncbi:MAG: sulfotransferase [Myxococcales bacterium]|nr:sulfotransferase [Deltaproteobacteria bacterium]NNL22931.1 sulfotransferase [Myxococcales bacterium]
MAAAPPHRTRIMRVVNRVGPLLAPRWPSLDVDEIVRAASRAAKSDQFGDPHFLEALPRFLDAIEREADLSWLGRVMCRQSLQGFLQNRFSVLRHRAAHPALAGARIERPVFIVGFPRTGTTILHNLLAQDPANRAPLAWEVQFPDPPPESATYETDPRIGKARARFGHMDTMAPSLASIHEIGADLPQECVPILAQTMLGPQLNMIFNVPTYQAWVDRQDHAPAYRYHRHFLEHLQSRHMKDRWVLKSPVHLRTLDALLTEYPDARIIFTHRDPAKTVPSLASLFYVIRGMASDSIDPIALGRQQMSWWADSLDLATAVRKQHSDKSDQFMDIQFEEVVADPVAALGRAYERFGIPWSSDVEKRMRSFLDRNPRGKHGSHDYEIEDFGLTLDEIRGRFERYCTAHEVPLVL